MTPYINTYYLKTEIKFSRNIEKINLKREIEKMKNKAKNNGQNGTDNTLSLGIAMGIGVIGAFVAMKDKFF